LKIFDELDCDKDRTIYVSRLVLNLFHPCRKENGRTQRAFCPRDKTTFETTETKTHLA